MHIPRWLCTCLLGCAWVGTALGQVPIFPDDFETGEACAWSVTVGGELCSRLYAHSGQNLYRIDTATSEAILVGPFNTGGPSINDIAIAKSGLMFGISLAKIWSIDTATGAASEIAAFDGSDGRTSLAFVPLDDSDPESAERLVTAGASGAVFEVNPATGATTLLGNYGLSGGQQIRSSGDIVSVHGLGTLATVDVGDTATDFDFLATINTTTWAATPIGGSSTFFDKIFGLGFWGGTIYGFVDDGTIAQTGQMITIDPVSGVGTLDTPGPIRWLGAGVGSTAPLVPLAVPAPPVPLAPLAAAAEIAPPID